MIRRVLLLLLLAAPAIYGQTPVSTPPPMSVDDKLTLIKKKQAEYDDSTAARDKAVAKLPAGTVTKFDLPYVDNPVQGMFAASNQRLDLYIPPGTGPFPLVVFIHGGAWKGGDKGRRGADFAGALLPVGIAVASVDYRFVFDAPFPGMFQDGIDAVAFLRAHAKEYNLNADKIGVTGESAGGHIAGLVSMAEGETNSQYQHVGPPVQAAVLLCGFYDITTETGLWKKGAFTNNSRDDFAQLYPNRTYDPAIAKAMSGLYHIHPGGPPVLIMHGDQDTTAPEVQSAMFADALKKAGLDVTYNKYPTYTHNLWHADSIADMVAFFTKHLQGK